MPISEADKKLVFEYLEPKGCWHTYPQYADIQNGSSYPCEKCGKVISVIEVATRLYNPDYSTGAGMLWLVERIAKVDLTHYSDGWIAVIYREGGSFKGAKGDTAPTALFNAVLSMIKER